MCCLFLIQCISRLSIKNLICFACVHTGFTGVDDPYEPPLNSEVTISSGQLEIFLLLLSHAWYIIVAIALQENRYS